MVLAGIDLAWQSKKNPSAIAIGNIKNKILTVNKIATAVYGVESVLGIINQIDRLVGIAIDASLIINNNHGMRECEKQIGRRYAARGASCHATNTTLYPLADSVYLAEQLLKAGFNHLQGDQWQIECYPHPALIEIFSLKKRLKYKKGKVAERRAGQIKLAALLRKLKSSRILKLETNELASQIMNNFYIESLQGQALKSNEDALDAIVCLYIAGLYAIQHQGKIFGEPDSGYIWVPSAPCF